MKALYAHAAHDLRLEDCPDGRPGPGQVLVRMARGGICGSDLHYFAHGGFGSVRLREPMILGHEVSGHVVEIGEGVDGLAEGDLVAVSPSRPCGGCAQCRRGAPNRCADMRFFGSAMRFPHVQGAFRERLVVDAVQCVAAHGLAPQDAAMAEPLAVALHAVSRAGDLLGRRVLVAGCGPIGTLVILAARSAGAAEVVAADIAPEPLGFARRAGADLALDAADPAALESLRGDGVDAAFECAGAEAALRGCIASLRPGGIAVQVGLGGEMAVPAELVAREISLRGSFRFADEFPVAVDMMRRGLIDPAPLVTDSFPLDAFAAAFAAAQDRGASMKVQLELS